MTGRTLNLGIRYDLISNAWANDVDFQPFLDAGRPNDSDNIQPRFGFAYQLSDSTVLRGGAGRYYGDTQTNALSFTYSFSSIGLIEYRNDGRADFVRNPWGSDGKPSRDEALLAFCSEGVNSFGDGCLQRAASELAPYPGYGIDEIPNSWQYSGGIQHQLSDVLGVEVDYVQTDSRNEKTITGNINLAFDPATGLNLPFSDNSTRPFPDWGTVGMTPHSGWSDYRGVQTSFTKRLQDRWQLSGNYLLSMIKDSKPNPVAGLNGLVPFTVARDLGEDYAYAATDQRHRAVVNGIWEVAGGFQVSGLYFFGSGARDQIDPGIEIRDLGNEGDYSYRLRRDGTIAPRNSLTLPTMHRVDMRFQQRIPLGGRVRLDGQFELFNLFNRFNPASVENDETNRRYGLPNDSSNVAYTPRVVQLGFRMTF